MLTTMPESQRWLARNLQHNHCELVLSLIYKKTYVLARLETLKNEIQEQITDQPIDKKDSQLKQLLTTYRRCLLIGCTLQIFQQLVGINTVMYYGPQIIIDTGLTLKGYSKGSK